MHYDTIKNNHNLPHDPFKAIVAPRPIGWIGSCSKALEQLPIQPIGLGATIALKGS